MENHCICAVRNIYRAITAFEGQLAKVVGLNINEAMLLCLLSDGDSLLAGEIAERLELTRSNTSKVIASLEHQACIRRQACKEDSRCQRFKITKKGLALLDKVHCDEVCSSQMMAEIKANVCGIDSKD